MLERPHKIRPEKTANGSSEMFVGPWDREILETGAANVVLQMLQDFKGAPEAIVLPETTARPLFYILHPVFAKLQETRGVQMPRFYFFNSRTPPSTLATMEKYKQPDKFGTTDTTEEFAPYVKELDLPSDLENEYLAKQHPEKMKLARDVMKERADEILALEKDSHIAVVDEYSSSGETAREVRRAFNDKELPVYAIFSSNADETVTTGYPYPSPDNPRRQGKSVLTYSKESAVGVKKEREGLHTKYSEVINDHPQPRYLGQLKKTLREELGAVGNTVADAVLEALDKKAAA